MPRSQISDRYRLYLSIALWSMNCLATSAYAAQFDLSTLRPSTLFVQAGVGDQSTRAYVAGAT
jgi:hypothetical protein